MSLLDLDKDSDQVQQDEKQKQKKIKEAKRQQEKLYEEASVEIIGPEDSKDDPRQEPVETAEINSAETLEDRGTIKLSTTNHEIKIILPSPKELQ